MLEQEKAETLCDLFPYQEEGAEWLSKRTQALLADEPGLGKTAQAISACDMKQASMVLILCPAIARENWIKEFRKFSKREWMLVALFGQDTLARIPPSITTPCGISCSYDLLLNNSVRTWILSKTWDVVIFDESHYLGHCDTQRTRFCIGKRGVGVVHAATAVFALSGTPARNHAGELWPLLYVFGVTRLSLPQFEERYCVFAPDHHSPTGRRIVGSKNTAELKGLLEKIMLRRKKDQVMKDLPKIHFTDVAVPLSPVDMFKYWHGIALKWETPEEVLAKINKEYEAQKAVLTLSGTGEAGMQALAGLTGDKTIGSRRFLGLAKVPAVVEIVSQELRSLSMDKIVLFCWHRDVVFDLRDRLLEFNALTLFGGTDTRQRQSTITKFQGDLRYRVLICQILAAGTAINLNSACEVGFVESSYVPSDNAQAALRVHRIGQDRPVRVRFFYAPDHIDETIQRILKRKTKDLIGIFDADTASGGTAQESNPFE